MIAIRRARPSDAVGIGAVHVASWRSAYANVLPDDFLSKLSVARQAGYYDRSIRIGFGVHVATVTGTAPPNIVGFSTAVKARPHSLGDGEVLSLYVLDDWKDQGVGRKLLRAAGQHLSTLGCRSAFAWVLRDNPSVYFYQRLGGKRIATSMVQVGAKEFPQTAYAWDPIETLLDVDA